MYDSFSRAATDRLQWLPRGGRRAKRCAHRPVLTQPSQGGRIAFDAVTFARAWAGDRSYGTFDRCLQNRPLELSAGRPRLPDSGVHDGVGTLPVVRRYPRATASAARAAATTARNHGIESVMGLVSVPDQGAAAETLRNPIHAAARGGGEHGAPDDRSFTRVENRRP